MKISDSNLFNYFSVSGDSKQIKKFPQKSGTLTTTGERGGGGLATLWWAPPIGNNFFLTPPLSLSENL